jgi:hypothetical protein
MYLIIYNNHLYCCSKKCVSCLQSQYWQPRCGSPCVSCFVCVARLAVVVCPMWLCSMTILVHCTSFLSVSLQMNQSILFYFFNKMRQNCPFCSKKKIVMESSSTYVQHCSPRKLLSSCKQVLQSFHRMITNKYASL